MSDAGAPTEVDEYVLRAIRDAEIGTSGSAGYLSYLDPVFHIDAQDALARLEQRGLVRLIRERPYGPCVLWPRGVTEDGLRHLQDSTR